MSIVVTGATGQLGRLAVEALLERGVPAAEVVATGRRTEVLADLAARGVVVRHADYDDVTSLKAAFDGAERLLLVSGSEVGQRVRQHGNAVAAAQAAGVGFVAYTSIVRADTSTLLLAEEHRATEQLLAAAGVPHALLRNSWYIENYTGQLPVHLAHGIAGAAGDGAVSAATRADYAAAAAAVVATDGHAGAVYELGGAPFGVAGIAEAVIGLAAVVAAHRFALGREARLLGHDGAHIRPGRSLRENPVVFPHGAVGLAAILFDGPGQGRKGCGIGAPQAPRIDAAIRGLDGADLRRCPHPQGSVEDACGERTGGRGDFEAQQPIRAPAQGHG